MRRIEKERLDEFLESFCPVDISEYSLGSELSEIFPEGLGDQGGVVISSGYCNSLLIRDLLKVNNNFSGLHLQMDFTIKDLLDNSHKHGNGYDPEKKSTFLWRNNGEVEMFFLDQGEVGFDVNRSFDQRFINGKYHFGNESGAQYLQAVFDTFEYFSVMDGDKYKGTLLRVVFKQNEELPLFVENGVCVRRNGNVVGTDQYTTDIYNSGFEKFFWEYQPRRVPNSDDFVLNTILHPSTIHGRECVSDCTINVYNGFHLVDNQPLEDVTPYLTLRCDSRYVDGVLRELVDEEFCRTSGGIDSYPDHVVPFSVCIFTKGHNKGLYVSKSWGKDVDVMDMLKKIYEKINDSPTPTV